MTANTVTFTVLDQPPAAPNADWSNNYQFQGPPDASRVLVGVQLNQIPVGCQVWFNNTDGTIFISLPPTTVQNPNSTFAVQVDLPADYSCTIQVSLAFNGNIPPPGASIQLFAAVPGGSGQDGDVPQAPAPDQLLGSVTSQL